MLGDALSALISAQLSFGVCFMIRVAINPREFLNRLHVRAKTHSATSATVARDKLGCIQVLLLQTVVAWRVLF